MASSLAKMKKSKNFKGCLGKAEVGKSGHGVVFSGLLLSHGSLNGVTTAHTMPDSDHTPLLPHSLQQKSDQNQLLRRPLVT